MSTILAVVRASTEQQEVESQKAELRQFCNNLGYNNIEWIAVAGVLPNCKVDIAILILIVLSLFVFGK